MFVSGPGGNRPRSCRVGCSMARLRTWLERLAGRLPPRLVRLAARVRWPLSPVPTLLAGLASLALAALLYGNCGIKGCPDVARLAAFQPNGAPVLLDRFGRKFGDLAPFERVVVPLDSLGPHVANAFIAVEDRRFYRHHGVDWKRVAGAALANLRHGGVTQGSSTITMQLARNVFPEELPGTEQTFRRKLNEARVAQMIEHRFGKRAILEMYLNHIYFGGGAYGIEAASRHYFGKSARRLRLSEAALLAALPKAPAHYDPRRHPDAARARRSQVLSLKEQQGLVEPAAAAESRAPRVRLAADPAARLAAVPLGAWFSDVVRDQLEERFGEKLYRSRLRIYTTLDQVAQRAAEQELERRLRQLDGAVRAGPSPLQGAVVMLDVHTGGVLALVGGRDPSRSRYNRAILARRQVGSAFKPFVFATALAEGIPTSQHIADQPLRLRQAGSADWEPENYDGTYEGEVSLRDALVRSRNVPTVRLALRVGIDDVARTARSAGVHEPMDETPALSLGTVALSPLQLATAYSAFAALGSTVNPYFVRRVEDANGEVLWEREPTPPRAALGPDVAYIVNDILQDAVNYGTGTAVRAAGYRGVVAGKTGTTNRATDAWFVGYTPDLVATIWIGYDQPSPLGSAATGGGLAAPVWGRMMRTYASARGYPAGWQQPPGVLWREIDPSTGMVLAAGCMPAYGSPADELFIADNPPATTCPHRDFWSDLWGRLGGIFGGGRENPAPDVIGGDDSRSEQRARAQEEELRRQLERRQREIEDFLRRRADELRERAQRRRGG
ncbi:MAG: PBP1A family penicillin-binding protein [Gemmatimonadetes bacterium]|nr:PBP1A family penicillin-binding protein [Gemmatimonadota bacterium]